MDHTILDYGCGGLVGLEEGGNALRWSVFLVLVSVRLERHLVVRFLEGHTLADVMREFKKHTSNQIIRQYQAEDNRRVLTFLEQAARHLSDQRYKVWEKGYDARNVFSLDFLRQKVDYIHQNPCQPRWQLVERSEAYPWSSARYYLLGEPAIIAIDDLGDWLA